MAIPAPATDAACLITGASSGLGAALARKMAARGHHLVVVARRTHRLEELAAVIRVQYGVDVLVAPCDLAREDERATMIETVRAHGRRVDVLINNAGVGAVGPFVDHPATAALDLVRVNVEAPVHLSETWIPGMVARGRGAVLNVSSIAAFAPVACFATYSACKTFSLNFSLSLHAELRARGVTVTCLAPGAIRSEFAAVAGGAEFAARIPPALSNSGGQIAAAAVRAMDEGRCLVVPGRFYQGLSAVARHLPRRPLVRLMSWSFGRERR